MIPSRSAIDAASPWALCPDSTDSQNRTAAGSSRSLTRIAHGGRLRRRPALERHDERPLARARRRRSASERRGSRRRRRFGHARAATTTGRRRSAPARRRTARRGGTPWCRRSGRASRTGRDTRSRRRGRSSGRPRRRRARRRAVVPARTARTCRSTWSRIAAFSGRLSSAESSSAMIGIVRERLGQRAADQRLAAEVGDRHRALVLLGQDLGRDLRRTARHNRAASRTASTATSLSCSYRCIIN